MKIMAFVVRGPFTPEEFGEISNLLRQIDARYPDRQYELVAVDADTTALDIAEKLLREALPPKPGRETTFIAKRRDPC